MRNTFFKALNRLGIPRCLRVINQSRRRIPILLFHRIHPTFDEFSQPLTPDYFESIIQSIKKHYHVVPLTHLLSNRYKLRGNETAITFDDAHEDFAEFAWPILKQHDLPVTVFIPTAYPENGTTWNCDLFKILINRNPRAVRVKGPNHDVILKNQTEWGIAASLLEQLYPMNISEILEYLKTLNSQLVNVEKVDRPFAPMMSWDTIRSLHRVGVNFQSHSHHHLFLKGKPEAIIENELEESLRIIKKELGYTPNMIAYPVGAHDAVVDRICGKYYDYGLSVGTQPGLLTNRYNIPRINVHDQNLEELMCRIQGFHAIFGR